MHFRRVRIVLAAIALVAPAAAAAAQSAGTPSRNVAFDRAVDAWLDAFARRHPSIAAGNGIHTYDGTMENFAARAMTRETAALRAERARIAAFRASSLPPDQRVDRTILVGIIDGWLLDVDVVGSWKKNPISSWK